MLARDGQLAEAVALYERALDFGLESGMVPDREARMVWASAMHNEARQLAREGDVSAATLVFARAKEINPDSTIDGPAEARKLGAEHFAERGRRLTDPIEAAAAFQTAFELDPETRVWPFTLNQICWEGVQMDAARNVLWICEKAVAAEPDNGGYRDSPGRRPRPYRRYRGRHRGLHCLHFLGTGEFPRSRGHRHPAALDRCSRGRPTPNCIR
jgi:tetratricopeptide (TPR) repeat protein